MDTYACPTISNHSCNRTHIHTDILCDCSQLFFQLLICILCIVDSVDFYGRSQFRSYRKNLSDKDISIFHSIFFRKLCILVLLLLIKIWFPNTFHLGIICCLDFEIQLQKNEFFCISPLDCYLSFWKINSAGRSLQDILMQDKALPQILIFYSQRNALNMNHKNCVHSFLF